MPKSSRNAAAIAVSAAAPSTRRRVGGPAVISASAPSPASSASGNGLALRGWAMTHAAASQPTSASRGPASRRTSTIDEQRHARVRQHAQHRHCTSETPKSVEQPAKQVGLSGPVRPEEVRVRQLPVGDPPRRLQHQPLVERVEPAQQREPGDQRRPDEEGDAPSSAAHRHEVESIVERRRRAARSRRPRSPPAPASPRRARATAAGRTGAGAPARGTSRRSRSGSLRSSASSLRFSASTIAR